MGGRTRRFALTIDASEYRDRQRRFAGALAQAGLDGAIVVSRGGSTFDRHANVFYLTGHYQHYSYLPDSPGLFSGRAHTVYVTSANAESILCASVPEYDAAAITAGEVRTSESFIETIAGALQSLGLASSRLGLVGSDVLPTSQWLALTNAAPQVRWEPCDESLLALRRIKSPAEQALIRRLAATNRRAVTAMLGAIRPGVSEAEALSAAAQVIIGEGAGIYYTAVSSGERIWQWTSSPLPGFSTRTLREGDLIRFDLGIVRDGYMSDFGRAVAVGEPNAQQRRLIDTLHGGLDAALAAIRPGAAVRDIVAAGDSALEAAGVVMGDPRPGVTVASYPVHWGHALGLGWERPWMTQTEGMTVEPGMYLAIERALTLEGVGTVAAEQNLLVGAHGIEILTEGPKGRWS
jgi:Xaa-Pro aminopeptidase